MADEVVFAFDETDAKRIARTVRSYEAGSTVPQIPSEQPRQRNYTRIPFRNDNSGTVPEYGLMRVTGMVDVDGRPIHKIDKPNSAYQRLYLVNGPNEVLTGKQGWGTWLWHADFVLYNTASTPAFGETWGPTNGAWTISKHGPGFGILGFNTGTGSASRTVAMQTIPEVVIGQADAAIAEDGSGTVRVYGGVAGSETDSGMTIANCFNKGPDIEEDDWVSVTWINGQPYVSRLKCPE